MKTFIVVILLTIGGVLFNVMAIDQSKLNPHTFAPTSNPTLLKWGRFWVAESGTTTRSKP